jgi:uncharacterized protein DUF222
LTRLVRLASIEHTFVYSGGRLGGRTEPDLADATQAEDPRTLEEELTELAAHLNSGTARFLALVGEFDARMGWAEWGCSSCAHWLAHYCGVSPITARHQVRVAARLRELPLIRASFESGELSYSKVRAVSRIATEATEAELLALARQTTAADLEAMCRSYTAATRGDGPDPYGVFCYQDEDGSWVVQGRLSPDAGALLRRALESGADSVRERTRGSAEPPSAFERYALAAQEMAETYLQAGPAARCGGDRYLVFVHAEADELRKGEGAQLDGAVASPETTRRLCCDASIVSLLHRGAGPQT